MFSGFVFVFCMIASPVSFIIWLIFYLLGCIQAFLMRKIDNKSRLSSYLIYSSSKGHLHFSGCSFTFLHLL